MQRNHSLEMADAPDSKSGVEIHAGSSPASGINNYDVK